MQEPRLKGTTEGATQGPVEAVEAVEAVMGAAAVCAWGDGSLFLAEVRGDLKHRLALTCREEGEAVRQ